MAQHRFGDRSSLLCTGSDFSHATGSTRRAATDTVVRATSRDLYEDFKRKFQPIGTVSHKKVGVTDLFDNLRAARDGEDFKLALKTMNLMYNFGVKLKHREIASKLLASAMLTGETAEAAELVRLYGTWLEHPPSKALVYAVMSHFLAEGDVVMVRTVAKAAREDWRMPLEAPLYALAVEAMLRLPELQEALHEAAALLEDAALMGVRLPAPVHLKVLDAALDAYEAENLPAGEDAAEDAAAEASAEAGASLAPAKEIGYLAMGLKAAQGLARDGHLRGGANAAVLCSMSWLFWRVAASPEAARAPLPPRPSFCAGDWRRCFDAAATNFGCHWCHTAFLPAGFFRALETSQDLEAARVVKVAKQRFGRFYPATNAIATAA